MTNTKRPEGWRGLAVLAHGEGGVGKSWFGQTTPEPRLVLDAEGGSVKPWRLVDGVPTRQRVIEWDPQHEDPPELGDWQVCHTIVRSFETLEKSYNWLEFGVHPFKSVVVDSLTEIQKRCKDAILAGDEGMTEAKWGRLLDKMEFTVRHMRDLVFHPTHPLEAVVFLALTDVKRAMNRPAIQGGLSVSLPGYVDVEGYMFVQVDDSGAEWRRMLIHPRQFSEAKDRTHVLSVRYGACITNPDVEEMLAVYNEEETA
jgi:hypothetical protein